MHKLIFNKSKTGFMLVFSLLLIGCSTSNTLNTPIEYFYTILVWLGITVLIIGGIVMVLNLINNLPKIIVSIALFFIQAIFTILIGAVVLTIAGFLGYLIIYKIFWLNTQGFFYTTGGLLIAILIWLGILALILNSPLAEYISKRYSSLSDKWNYIDNISTIRELFLFRA